jgi:hypothetical protein
VAALALLVTVDVVVVHRPHRQLVVDQGLDVVEELLFGFAPVVFGEQIPVRVGVYRNPLM